MMWTPLRTFLLSLQFLTRFPVEIKGELKQGDMPRAMIWFPLVGLLLGLFVAAALLCLGAVLPPGPAAAFGLILWVMITGNLHLDGLIDTADAFFCSGDVARRLEIMKDSRIGAHGAAAAVLTLLCKWSLLQSFYTAGIIIIALPLITASARWSMVLAAGYQKKARPGGLARLMTDGFRPSYFYLATLLWLAPAAALTAALSPFPATAPAAASAVTPVTLVLLFLTLPLTAIVTWAFGRYVAGKIGGLTGDTLGATNELVELVLMAWLAAVAG
ncbi:MAG TPA: adenosylcobinamide-GDP ribazoletransferase [Firmicutes bacterium]|nr:adenosylcobinamide-GDP ribazoletransferase [Bacillota bacterium]